jgi:hypothetical protein
MHLSRLLGMIVLVAAGSGPASADILVWRDTAGVSHYTNDLANVPPEYRAEAMTVAKDWARAEPPPEPVAMPVAATVAAEPGAAQPARDGYEAAYLAGLRAAGLGQSTSGAPPASMGSVVPSAETQPQNAAVADRLAPVLVERHQARAPDEPRVSTVPSSPPLQGPAGPPPISDR